MVYNKREHKNYASKHWGCSTNFQSEKEMMHHILRPTTPLARSTRLALAPAVV